MSAWPVALVLYAAPPAFEVASIKRDVSSAPGTLALWFPNLHIERITLKDLVILAYQIHDFQVTGGPGWIDTDRYNIEAKVETHAVANQQFVGLQRLRLQTLLRDRFHLKIPRETKELPVYDLTVAKGGPKLQAANCMERVSGDTAIAQGKTRADYCGPMGGSLARGRLESPGASMAFLASYLSGMLGRTVVDKTGLAGEFSVQLAFAPVATAVPSPDEAAESGPDFFTAVQDQLGLKLKASKGPVEVLVIDLVERPSEN